MHFCCIISPILDYKMAENEALTPLEKKVSEQIEVNAGITAVRIIHRNVVL